MKNLLVSLSLLALVGCGSNDSGAQTSSSSLVGTWVDQVDSTTVLQMVFTATTWKMEELDQLTSGAYALEIDSGTYTATAGAFTLTLTASSCEGVQSITNTATAGTFTRTGNALDVTLGTSFLAFQLATAPPTGMGAATIGCFNSSGTFTAHAVTTVP